MGKMNTTLSQACEQLNQFFSNLDNFIEMIESQLVSNNKTNYTKHELYTKHPRGKFYISDYLSLFFTKSDDERGTFQVLVRLHDELLGQDSEWGEINPFTNGEAELALIMTDMPYEKWEKSWLKYTGEEILKNSPSIKTIENVDDFFRGYMIWGDIRINFIIKVENLVTFSECELDSQISNKVTDIVPDMEILLKNYQLSS